MCTLMGCIALLLLTAAALAVDLRADSRLEVRLTLTEPMISLRELLTRLQQEAGVPLYAAPDVFTVGEATREYYIYRTAPPAAGKVVVQERRAFP
ncbi:MAG: hypothetical protein NZ874_08815 [Fimbriimonadales bacterium]|nr:hypothetical protein [Fimbriimonadales bacterium]